MQMNLEMMVACARKARESRTSNSLTVIYEPAGRAREYAARAVNLFSGCDHGCAYCYAPGATHKTREAFYRASVRVCILRKLEADCASLAGREIEPVLMSFTCDPYQNCEGGITRKAIEIFRRHNVPFQILTKGGMRAARDFDLYSQRDVFASTLTFTDPVKSREWEPGAALPEDRFEAVRTAHRAGIKTWVSLEPVIDPAQSLEIIEIMHPYVDLLKIGTWNHDARAKAIDWRRFGTEAVERLGELGKDYYIKDDLRKHL
jgi:DNA repair photolyase